MRLLMSAVAACLVTLFLFFFMQSMISAPVKPPEKTGISVGLGMVRVEQVAETTESMPARPRRSPLNSLSVPMTPQLLFDDFKAPALPSPEASMPELARVKPGGKPYLGEFIKPSKKLSSPTKVVQKPSVSNKQPTPSKPVESPVSKVAVGQIKDVQKPVDLRVAQNGPGRMTSDTAGLPDSSMTRPVAGERGGISAGSVDDEVVALLKTTPVYPRKAARSKQEGWVKVEFTITEDGLVSDPKVISAKPRRIFDRAAIKAIRNWRFKPRRVDGRAVSRRAVQVIEFRLATG